MKRLQRITHLIVHMLRPRTVLMLWLFLLIGWMAAAKQQFGWQLVPLAVSLAAWFTNATCINDLADVEIDKINLARDPARPLVQGDTGRRTLAALAVCAGATAVITAGLVHPLLGLIFALTLVLNWVYSMQPLRVSYRGFWAALLLPVGYAGLPFFSGLLAVPSYTLSAAVLGTAAGLYVAFIGRILLKDFRDVNGDRAFGKRTFLVRHGARATCLVAAVCWLAGDVILVVVLHDRELGFVLLAQPFIAGIIVTLRGLSRATDLQHQLLLVGMVGKLGNGLLLLLLIFEAIAGLAVRRSQAPEFVGAVLLVCAYLTLLQYDGLRHYAASRRRQ